jgi:hypothetical protein
MPFDVETPTPAAVEGWGGMSGAGVLLPDGRLIGLVVSAEADHQERRLYIVPLAAVLRELQESHCNNGPLIQLEARAAPQYRNVLTRDSVGADGLPRTVGDVHDLAVFGVKPADIPGEPTFLEYVPRSDDDRLREALTSAVHERRMLLVVGDSAAGKSRSTVEALRAELPSHRLLRPRRGALRAVETLPVSELTSAVVWLDDAELYADADIGETIGRLLDAGIAVVGTIRRAALESLTSPGALHAASGVALQDTRRVRYQNWRLKWTSDERDRVFAHVADSELLRQVTSGVPLGVWCVAGPLLVEQLRQAQDNEERPCRYGLVRVLLAWYGTGVRHPMPLDVALSHVARMVKLDYEPDENELMEALAWATTPVIGANRPTRQALVLHDPDTNGLTVHDYIVDQEQRDGIAPAPIEIVRSARPFYRNKFTLGIAAYRARCIEDAIDAFNYLIGPHGPNPHALYNVALLRETTHPEIAEFCYEQAIIRGHSEARLSRALFRMENGLADVDQSDRQLLQNLSGEGAMTAMKARAMNLLGRVVITEDRDTALQMFERAALAGHVGAMFNIAQLLASTDTLSASRWYERAAAAGHAGAMNNLARLLVERDATAARVWFTRAAELGHSEAARNLETPSEGAACTAAFLWDTTLAGHTLALNDPERLFELDPEWRFRDHHWFLDED